MKNSVDNIPWVEADESENNPKRKKNMVRKLFVFVFILMMPSVIQSQTIQQADSLHQRGRELLNSGDVAEGRECTRQAMEIRKKLLGEVSEDYINSLNNYAMSFYMTKDSMEAFRMQSQVLELCSKLPVQHPKLYLFNMYMGTYCHNIGDNQEAAHYWEKSLLMVEKFSEEYEWLLERLASMYTALDDRQNLMRIAELTDEHNRHELTLPCNEPKCMLDRAQYYSLTGNSAEAKECFLKVLAMPIKGDSLVMAHTMYAYFLSSEMQDRVTAAEHQLMAAKAQKDLTGEDENYADIVYSAGHYYSYAVTADYWQKAIECYEKAKTVYQQSGNSEKEAACWKAMGDSNYGLKNYAQSKVCYQNALAYYEGYDKDNEEYPKLIENIASAEKANKEYDASIAHYQQAMKLYEERGMMREYGNAQNGLSLCFFYAGKDMSEASDGKYDDAVKAARMAQLDRLIDAEKEGLDFSERYLGKHTYARSLDVIASCYVMKEEYQEGVDYYKQYMANVRDAVREEFRLQNESERMATWMEESGTMESLKELLIDIQQKDSTLTSDVAALAYDGALLSKGILLNSSIEFETVLREKGDKKLIDMYKQTQDNEKEIERLRKEAASDADLEKILQLTRKNQQLQMELSKGCKELDDFTKYISYDWKDVKAALSKNDVAIEFSAVKLGIGETESHMVALVLTKEMDMPVAVTLWDEDNLMECQETEFISTLHKNIINTIFNGKDRKDVLAEMKDQLETIDTPYKPELSLFMHYLINKADTIKGEFIPDNIFLLNYQDLFMQDDFTFSTPYAGHIVWNSLAPYLNGKKRIFFSADGTLNHFGIEYLLYDGKSLSEQFEVYRLSSTKELCYKHDRIKPTKAVLFGDINYNDKATATAPSSTSPSTLRGSGDAGLFADLGNTLREVNDIQDILRSKGINDTERFRDTEASKTAFMGLTDSKVNFLHIATHGMYRDMKGASDAESMKNSLLAFAGANVDDDAFVTAEDISTMNLRQCDVAVLSACETGLGKLGGDGVFGLQRGFKNAGVKTLLMSLKNVYDDSTADLMISFYRHLMNGSSKREAFVKAQQDIRSKGFNDPKYWASFIMLDGID